MSKKILITGGLGQLGRKLNSDFRSSYKIINSSRTGQHDTIQLDVSNSKIVKEKIDQLNPDIIFNCSSFNNVDECETQRNQARSVIVGGISNLIKYSKKQCRIIHFSSDYIFDGIKGDYVESDTPNPLNYYGKLKLESENLLRSSNRNFAIVRCSAVFSHFLDSKSNFFAWVYNNLKKGKKIKVVNDQYSRPTPVELLSKFINTITPLELNGIFNVGVDDSCSRFDFAKKICETFRFDSKLIHQIKSKDLHQLAIRPKNTCLNISKMNNELDIDIYSLSYYLDRIRDVLVE